MPIQIEVNGPNAHPLYEHLINEKPAAVEWNFEKFLINKRGKVVERFNHKASFADIESAVQLLL